MSELDELRGAVATLVAKDQIRDCLYRYSRAIDRIDAGMLSSVFHDDAIIDFGVLFKGSKQEFIETSIAVQKRQTDCQHLIGNILIELDGDVAAVESYEMARHLTPLPTGIKDMVMAARTLDRFERRDGRWAIAYRKKVLDWSRFLSADRSMHDNSPVTLAVRDESDLSYTLFAGLLGRD